MEPIRIFSDSDSKLPLLLLYEDLPRFVVPRLPNAEESAVRLELVDVGAGNPDLLRRVDRSSHDRRRNNGSRDNRSRDDARADDCVRQNATDNPADETRPEMTPSTSPRTVMVVHRRRTMMHHRRGAMMHHRRRPAEAAAMTAKAATRAAVRTSEQCSCRQNRAKCKYKFLVHVCLSFLRFCGHVKIGHELSKN